MLYSATKIITLHNEIIDEGSVRVVDRRIADVGKSKLLKSKYPHDKETCFNHVVLMPGLINAHTHLEEGSLRDEIGYSNSYAVWLEDVLNKKHGIPSEDLQNAVHLGALECLESGTTTVLDATATGAAFKVLFNERLRSIIFLEFQGNGSLSPQAAFNQSLLKAEGFMANELSNWGVSPVSPFFLPKPIFKMCLDYAREQNVFILSHVGESEEEQDFFRQRCGNLAAFLDRLKIAAGSTHPGGPAGYLLAQNLIPPRMIIVHGNFIEDKEIDHLARLNASVVICPRSYLRFHHSRFQVKRYLEKGVKLCLGTESLAASESLDMFEEMYYLKKLVPDLSNETILKIAVQGGAQAIGLKGVLGQIRPGFLADIVGVELHHSKGMDILDELINEDHDVRFVMVNGKEILI
jgi:cytosine/adenosine deaminase-related metal-dependent hydrolase